MDDEQGRDEGDDGDETPRGLQAGELVVEPRDHHEPDAVQERREWKQCAVGAAGDEPHDDVGAQQQAQQDRDEEHDARWDLGVRAERGDRVGSAGDQGGHDHERQLGGASAASEW